MIPRGSAVEDSFSSDISTPESSDPSGSPEATIGKPFGVVDVSDFGASSLSSVKKSAASWTIIFFINGVTCSIIFFLASSSANCFNFFASAKASLYNSVI